VAFGMAKIQEECVMSSRRSSKFNTYTTSSWQQNRNALQQNQNTQVGNHKIERGNRNENFSNSVQKPNFPLQRLSSTQMAERRKNGLCYTCDEKWNANNVCTKGKVFLMEGCGLFTDQFDEEDLDVNQNCDFEEGDKD
jgi:hypothetical protein